MVRSIPAVGGTKDWDWPKIQELNPDLIILDKEENPKFMSEGHSIPFVATHVHDIDSSIEGIRQIHASLSPLLPKSSMNSLSALMDRWTLVKKSLPLRSSLLGDSFPGLLEWIQKPASPIQSIYYIIWRNPWMVAARPTFIGAMNEAIGFSISPHNPASSMYPEIKIEDLDRKSTLLLFSSEPYPFHKKKTDIEALGFPSAIVDGQSFSWFGIHSLTFLENQLRSK